MDQFENLAREFVTSFGEVLPGYVYDFTNKRTELHYIYFDLVFVDLQGALPAAPPVSGRFTGFTIDRKTLEIKFCTPCELGELDDKQKEIEEAYQKTIKIDTPSSLDWFKSKYNLNPLQLFQLKGLIKNTSWTRSTVMEKIDELVTKIR